ncbi:SAM-dependent methyltransferase [Lacrimispora sp.]|uniref:SAM-dependent methyltransferase n=1 Tax=Lacrimispora sp. TaxID=2719234 RepID=UPI003991A854
MNELTVKPIGRILTCNGLKTIQLEKSYLPALTSLEGFSHINVLWWFDACDNLQDRSSLKESSPYKKAPSVMGTFATRSPKRPNPIALSAAEIISVHREKGIIALAYIDAEDNSPVLDLKPYTPSLDRIENPRVPAWCSHWPKSLEASADFPWEKEFNF